MRGYQRDFSLHSTNVHNYANRRRKARTVLAVLDEVLGGGLAAARVLDVGASTGAITAALAEQVNDVVGIDIDNHAITIAARDFGADNCRFLQGDAMHLAFADGAFDVLLCAHVYEHVPDADQLMREIRRVLKPGGWCYFSAGNRLAIDEPHYHLPFLSVMPRPLSHVYMRATGKGRFYYEKHLTYWSLKRLVDSFEVHDFTRALISEPARYHTDYMLPPGSRKQQLALWLVDHAMWLCPGYIWLLQKPAA